MTEHSSQELLQPPQSEMPIKFGAHSRLCFYPSCHHRTPWIVLRLDCDLFVMSDKSPGVTAWKHFEENFQKHGLAIEKIEETPGHVCFRSQEKTVWVFREDNRQTLQRIAMQGLTIHHFIGICDGCMEGGNHECVHERPFISHLLPLAADGMKYTTDHSHPLQDAWRHGQPRRKFQERVCWGDFSELENHRQMPVSDQHTPVDTCFELQGILFQEGKDFQTLTFGPHPTELNKLSPFRSLFNIGILAEYQVGRDKGNDKPQPAIEFFLTGA